MTKDDFDYVSTCLSLGVKPKLESELKPELGFVIRLREYSRQQQLLGRACGMLNGLVLQLPDGDYKKQMLIEIDRFDRDVNHTLNLE